LYFGGKSSVEHVAIPRFQSNAATSLVLHVRWRNVGVSKFDVCGGKRQRMEEPVRKGKYMSFPIGSIVIDGNLNLFCAPVASFSRQHSVVELGVLFGSGRSLEMVRAEVPALSRAVPQDGNERNSMENLKR
jgi:hypothetical protein